MSHLTHSELDRHTIKVQDELLNQSRDQIKRLLTAVNDLLESAQGGKYGEIVCDADDFSAVEKIITTEFEGLQ